MCLSEEVLAELEAELGRDASLPPAVKAAILARARQIVARDPEGA